MDFRTHAVAQHSVHTLMPTNAGQAFELRRHNRREEMLAVTLHLKVFAAHAGNDVGVELFGGWIGHDALIISQAGRFPAPLGQFLIL